MRRFLLILIVISGISSCRYWSLYRFADQFCYFDQQIEVVNADGLTQIAFADPVLPTHVFDRYFKASPSLIRDTQERKRQTYTLVKPHAEHSTTLQLHADFSRHSRKPLLSAASIDPALSSVFTPAFVTPILKSVCTDNFELSLSKLDVRFELRSVPDEAVPNETGIVRLFGEGDITNTLLTRQRKYMLDFVATTPNIQNKTVKGSTKANSNDPILQNKPVSLAFSFNRALILSRIAVDYENYQLQLDFAGHKGRLLVIRNADEL